jgi:hypothetical protein
MSNWHTFCENKHIQKVAKDGGLDISGYDPKELCMGYEAEKEHDDGSDVDVVGSDLDLVKITVAHLREDPKYYTKLKKVHSD